MKNADAGEEGTRPDRESASPPDVTRLEFHRNGFALMPDPGDPDPGIAVMLIRPTGEIFQRSCSCGKSKHRTCRHERTLEATVFAARKNQEGNRPEDFKASLWYELAGILADASRDPFDSVKLKRISRSDHTLIRVFDQAQEIVLDYLSKGSDKDRFIERCSMRNGLDIPPFRGDALERLASLTISENERLMNQKGLKTRLQAIEASFWYRFAYHGYRELGISGFSFQPAIEENSGRFTITCADASSGNPRFRVYLPRNKVKKIIGLLAARPTVFSGIPFHPVPLRSLYRLTAAEGDSLEVRSVLKFIRENGEEELIEREELEKFRYGELIYIPKLGLMAELENRSTLQGKRPPFEECPVLKHAQLPAFLELNEEAVERGELLVDRGIRQVKIFREIDRIEISPTAIDRDWLWLDILYGIGESSVSLSDILRANSEGRRFIEVAGGWIDCNAAGLKEIYEVERADPVRLSRMEVYRLLATVRSAPRVTGGDGAAEALKRLLDLKPGRRIDEIASLSSPLRPYQQRGLEWLCFLYENGFGGLLCDDMGLGKTHEIMAFMLYLREHAEEKLPFLVVCPTTVLSHWEAKIRTHAPSLKAAVHHGVERRLEEALKECDVLITSYGILRIDIEKLEKTRFPLAVFDEIQNLKNRETRSYAAASRLPAGMKVGLTGTPIENRLIDLKNLLDLAVPGYLGPDDLFLARYGGENGGEKPIRKELSRMIRPFTLRRLKKTVLEELPEKIEDTRTCLLSEKQVKLYRDAVSSRGAGLVETLRKDSGPIPYIHIFALITLLKQICDHPALVEGGIKAGAEQDSGKWELFKDLLCEALDSGQKVVVFSQFLGMIDIIENHLTDQGIGFVSLTGKSRRRGEIVSRFNRDPDCRVFVGSLKAGGTGIDLIGGSVVIHYDRWWNAAREDQATDRVHRIGQLRGVQVFKLVTLGTLEEKISAIIEKKRNLLEDIVLEDDPGLLKAFSKEELLEILTSGMD